MISAGINFGDLVLLIVEVFLFVIWIWILFAMIADLFRRLRVWRVAS